MRSFCVFFVLCRSFKVKFVYFTDVIQVSLVSNVVQSLMQFSGLIIVIRTNACDFVEIFLFLLEVLFCAIVGRLFSLFFLFVFQYLLDPQLLLQVKLILSDCSVSLDPEGLIVSNASAKLRFSVCLVLRNNFVIIVLNICQVESSATPRGTDDALGHE